MPDNPVETRTTSIRCCQQSAAVATAFPLATEAGLEILSAGGNAIDAAVAAAWALCVCEPSASGLGGQTVLLIHFADGRTRVVDGHSYAPAGASPSTISVREQRRGHRACTVPLTPATLDWVQRAYGVLGCERVMAPAIRVADEGYAITRLQHRQTRWVADYLRESAAADLFLRNGSPPEIGSNFRQPALAGTLRRLADRGIDDFYRGGIARQIASDMARHGGLMTEDDLASCGPPTETEPLSTVYRGHRVLTVPPPGGGFQLLLALDILERLRPSGFSSACDDWREAIALTTSAVFRERERQSLPTEISTAPLRNWLSNENRALQIAREFAEPVRFPMPATDFVEEPGDTTHLSVSDRHGNVVMLTQSIQSVFGAKVANPDLGFLYNNYLFTCPREQHPYALRGRCRPRSNAAPTLVLRQDAAATRPVLALGAAGSRRIISSILQVVSGVIDHGLDIAAAVAAPRVHGFLGQKVWIERPAASDSLLENLGARCRKPIVKSRHHYAMGSVQALEFIGDGQVRGAADPRRDGTAGVLA
jgi:gamma-glutamyltranspeptidase/glutathione hydrolase